MTGLTPALTGPEAVDLDGLAEIAAGLTGRPVRRTVVTDEEHRASLTERGVPEDAAGMLTGMFEASRKGEFAAVGPALEQLLGRRPMTIRDVLAARLGR